MFTRVFQLTSLLYSLFSDVPGAAPAQQQQYGRPQQVAQQAQPRLVQPQPTPRVAQPLGVRRVAEPQFAQRAQQQVSRPVESQATQARPAQSQRSEEVDPEQEAFEQFLAS